MTDVDAPRLLVGAPASGSGKTTFTCGLMHALVARGLSVAAFKCGPDYIDPMFHSEVIGARSRNVDLFFAGEDHVRRLIAEGASSCDLCVIEGAMGYYDGIAVSADASAWDVARATETPAVLVVDGRGRARSIAAEILGFARFRAESQVRGVVLNRASEALYPRLKALIEEETGIAVLGYLPVLDDCNLESRHLGLVTASEVVDLRSKLDRLAEAMRQTVDIDGLLALAGQAPALAVEETVKGALASSDGSKPRIAVAHDDAFCFYYAETLELLKALGAEIVEFSPLADRCLPEGCAGLYLGGGYPELHARRLSQNASMRASVLQAVQSGVPTLAECGGFLYLHEQLEDDEGEFFAQVGAVPGRAFRTSRLGRFGYVTLTAEEDGLLAQKGGSLKAHEFHYWESEDPGAAYVAEKPQSNRKWSCCVSTSTLHAGFPHLYLPANPEAAARFVDACARHARETAADEKREVR